MVLRKTTIPNRRQPWTPSQVNEMKRMAKQGTHAAQIARKLKRTEGATRQKAFSERISLDTRDAQKQRKAAQSRAGKIGRAAQQRRAA